MGFLQGDAQIAAPSFGAGEIPQLAIDPSGQGAPMDVSNILQTANLPQQAPDIPTGKRRSVLDTIGGIADVLARVGGADPLYQAGLDARHDREMAGQIEPLKLENLRQQIAANNQKFAAGENELAGDVRSRVANALAGFAGAENPTPELWDQIAGASGLPPDQAQKIGAILQVHPEIAGALAQSMGYTPKQTGSLPSSIQNYAMYQKILQEKGPEAAEQFMKFAQPSMNLTPAQAAQLALRQATLDEMARNHRAMEDIGNRNADNAATKASGGGSTLTNTQRGVIASNMALLPNIEKQLQTVRGLAEQMDKEGTLATGALGGMVPGGLAGDTAAKFDRAIANLQSQFRKISRTPGEGSTSDYETQLQQATMPSRTTNSAGRKQAIDDLTTQIAGLQEAYQGLLNPAASLAPAGGGAPLPGTPPPRNRRRSQRTVTVSNW